MVKKKLSLVILAGGKGSRIKNLISNKQKCIAQINNKPFLDYVLNSYLKFDFDKVYVLTGKGADEVKKIYHNKEQNFIKIVCLKENKPMGTAGALYKLKNKLNNFILINGDSFLDIDFNMFLKQKKKFICKMSLTKNINYFSNKKLSNLFLDNNIVNFSNKSKYMNGGVYLFNKKIFKYISNRNMSLENDVLPKLINNKLVSGEIIKDKFFYDIGTKKNFINSKKILKKEFYKPAAFLDRDGVINHDYGYVKKFKNFRFRNGVAKGLKFLINKGYYIFIVTNQAGIAKKKMTLENFKKLHIDIKQYLLKKKIHIDNVSFCPHHKNALLRKYKKKCNCRKPNNGLIINLKKSWDINLKNSFFIGDKETDKQCARKSNLKFFFAEKNFFYQIKKIYNNI